MTNEFGMSIPVFERGKTYTTKFIKENDGEFSKFKAIPGTLYDWEYIGYYASYGFAFKDEEKTSPCAGHDAVTVDAGVDVDVNDAGLDNEIPCRVSISASTIEYDEWMDDHRRMNSVPYDSVLLSLHDGDVEDLILKDLKAYKFSEQETIAYLKEYIDLTYGEHYAKGEYQGSDIIMDEGHGEGFFMGSILKYWKRYGKKEGKNLKDLLKIIHYTMMVIHLNHSNEVGYNPVLEDKDSNDAV
tara:strand:- start:3653 stop:4378 length:726 start_codon:yes stop_codon:yes gene_type:complete